MASLLGQGKVTCWLCNKFSYGNLKGVLRHMAAVHSWEPNLHIVCGIEGCSRNYTNFFSFKKHVYRKHRSCVGKDLLAAAICEGEGEDNDALSDDDDGVNPTSRSYSESYSEIDDRRFVAGFMLKSRAVYKVTEVHLSSIVDDVSALLDRKAKYTKNKMLDIANTFNLPAAVCDELTNVFDSPVLTQPFAGFETKYLQDKFMQEKMGLVLPEEIKIKQTLKRVRMKSKTTMKLVWDCAYYIPLLFSLKSFLSRPGVLEDVLAGHKRSDGLSQDYCDSSSFATHPLFSRDPHALMLFVYYDDVEVCNPLGSRAKKHKLALFYYSLGNLSLSNRSSLNSIQLFAVIKSTDLQEYGPNVILEPLMRDVETLEGRGLTVTVDGEEHTFRGTIVMVPGDNLASQYLGGYKALNAALRKCRHCLAVGEDMKTKFYAEDFQPRTRETHAYHCASLEGPTARLNATTFGITCDSLLNTSKFFHVTEGLVPDIMHDVLEGSLSYEIKELIRWLVSEEKVLTLAELNEAISSFPYWGSDAKDKPCPFGTTLLTSNDHGLRLTATQTWCLARLLPLLIGEKIPEGDDHWDNFLLHLKILDYCFAPVVSTEMIAYLRELIHEHHQTFVELYPTCPVIPKMHYMVHYPEWIKKYGPLIRFWVMRFEGKHNFFKDIAHRIKNFRNVAKSMAERHQLYSCYISSSDIHKKTTSGPIKNLVLADLPYKRDFISAIPSVSEDSLIQTTSWFQEKGTLYKPGGVVVLHVDNVPVFGNIIDLFVLTVDDFYFVCEILHTECFNPHFHAYQVCKADKIQYHICKVSHLSDHYCLSKYQLSSYSSSWFVSLKYYLVDEE